MLCAACGGTAPAPAKTPDVPVAPLALIDGPVVGDPAPDGALVWARAGSPGWLHVEVGANVRSSPMTAEHDHGATVRVAAAAPVDVRVWATVEETPGKPPREARTIAPLEGELRIAFGGDMAGQNVCRHASEGFAAMAALNERPIDLFIGLGDMIYADGTCTDVGPWGQPQIAGGFAPSEGREAYWAHWRYARADPHLAQLLTTTPYVAVWDDHEVVNDFDSEEERLPIGLSAFRDHNPLPEPLYRSFPVGDARLIVLDTRRHRDANETRDSDEEPKSMLGEAQHRWLLEQLSEPARWHLIVSSVPIAIPTGNGPRDGWSDLHQETGYERELRSIFEAARDAGATLVFLTTDVHFAAVHRLEPLDGYVVHEVATGPLSAGLYPSHELDPTFRPERLFFHGPEGPVVSWEEAKTWFNWGEVHLGAEALTLSVRGIEGELFSLRLEGP